MSPFLPIEDALKKLEPETSVQYKNSSMMITEFYGSSHQTAGEELALLSLHSSAQH